MSQPIPRGTLLLSTTFVAAFAATAGAKPTPPPCGAAELHDLETFCNEGTRPLISDPLDSQDPPPIEAATPRGVHLVQTSTSNSGVITFTPEESGVYTLYVGTPKMPTRVLAGTDDEVAPICENWITVTDSCRLLRRAGGYELEAGTTYRIEFGPIFPQRWVRVRIEPPEAPAPPSGETIVFAAALDGQGATDLYTVAPDGNGVERLTDTAGEELFPTWSPDRSKIAFIRDHQLFVLEVATGDETLVAPMVGRDEQSVTAVAWSPDGMRLAYPFPRPPHVIGEGEDMVNESYETVIHFVDPDGENDVALPEPAHNPPGIGTLIEPVWASNDRLAINALDDCPDCAGGNFYLTILEDGTDRMDVAFGEPAVPFPVHGVDWSPDAGQWVYTARAKYAIYESPGVIATAAAQTLTGSKVLTTAGAWNPHWSPNAEQIAFLRADGIWVMDAGGGNQTRILDATGVRGIDW